MPIIALAVALFLSGCGLFRDCDTPCQAAGWQRGDPALRGSGCWCTSKVWVPDEPGNVPGPQETD